MRYGQIAELLNGIAERFGWDKIMEGDNVIGLKQVNCFFFYYLSFILVNTKDIIMENYWIFWEYHKCIFFFSHMNCGSYHKFI